MIAETVWNDDGHTLFMVLNQSQLEIQQVHCPNGPTGDCQHSEIGCIVQWFVGRFGLDCHVGVAPPEEFMRIAWSWSGSRIDPDASQVWIMSTKDEFYSAWAASQRDEGT